MSSTPQFEAVMLLFRVLLTVGLMCLPYLVLKKIGTVVVDRRPDRASLVSLLLMLLAPILAILVVLIAVTLHWSWIEPLRPRPGTDAGIGTILLTLGLVLTVMLPVIGSLLWLGWRFRPESRSMPPGQIRLTRAVVGLLVGINVIGLALSVGLRHFFQIPTTPALIITASAILTGSALLGPPVLRYLIRPDEDSQRLGSLAGARALLSAEGLDASRLEVGDAVGGMWANGIALGAVPGKYRIVLTRSLVNLLRPDEITAVVAHEIGHIRQHHVLKLLVSNLIIALLVAAVIRGVLGTLPSTGTLWDALGMITVWVALAPLVIPASVAVISRRFEWQADRFARDRGSGDALASALEKIVAATTGRMKYESADLLLALHPSPDERIRSLRGGASANGAQTHYFTGSHAADDPGSG